MTGPQDPGHWPEQIDTYRLFSRIGKGGMGEVFRGHDSKLDRPVALKRVRLESVDNREAKDRFHREARALARVRHPSVVEVYDWIENNDGDWLVMELLEGQSLSDRLSGGPLPIVEAMEIARDLADGLAAVHRQGIVHRDLKPGNVMCIGENRVKLLDFGLAKRVMSMDGLTLTETISQKGQLLGTVRFMSPEQAAGGHVDHRSDLFSLGVLIYEMLGGVSPFRGDYAVETLTRICTFSQVPLNRVRLSIPRPVSDLVQRLLQKDPSLRVQSAEEVASLLRTLGSGLPADTNEPAIVGYSSDDSETLFGEYTVGEQLTVGEPTAVAGRPDPPATGSLLRTLLITDLVDSTAWVERLGDQHAAELFERHDRLARDSIQRFGGREIDKSDGFFILFDRPIDAVRFALDYHRALDELGDRQDLELTARVGIHVGEVVLRAASAQDVAHGAKPLEVEGLAKATAGRLMSLAAGRQTLLSRGAHDLARRGAVGIKDLPEDLQWREHGRYRLQGVEEPLEVFEVGVAANAPLSPPSNTAKAKRVVEVSGRFAGRSLVALLVVSVALLVLAVLGGRRLWEMRKPVDPTYVVVPAPEIDAPDGRAEEIRLEASAVHSGVLRALMSLQGISAVEPTSQDLADNPVELAQTLGADAVLRSKISCDLRACRLSLKRIDAATGGVNWDGGLALREDGLLNLSLTVADQVRSGFPEARVRKGVFEQRISAESFRRLVSIMRGLALRGVESKGKDQALNQLAELRQAEPEFLEVYRIEAEQLAERFQDRRDPEDLRRASEVIAAGRRIAPNDPRILRAAVEVSLVAGRLDEAGELLNRLESWEPGDADFLERKARLKFRQGELQEAKALMDEVLRRRPSWSYFASAAVISRAMGETEATRSYVNRMLAQAPYNYFSQSIAAESELLSGRFEQAVKLYEKLVQRSPEAAELNNLGVAYFLLGRYSDASRVYAQVLELNPNSVSGVLNLADAYLLASKEGALDLYQRVLELIDQDPNPTSLMSARAQALVHLGRTEEAVAAIQERLRHAPDDPLVAFEAAVVYAVAGEETSALLHARRALAANFDPIWFDSPWFDAIRKRLPATEEDVSSDPS